MTVKEKVIEIVRKVLKLDRKTSVDGSTDLQRDLSATSIQLAELAADFEIEFNIDIPEDREDQFKSIDGIVTYIESFSD
jgi:acyl carrier protein